MVELFCFLTPFALAIIVVDREISDWLTGFLNGPIRSRMLHQNIVNPPPDIAALLFLVKMCK